MNTDPTTDRPRALHLLEAADFLRDAHFRDGLSVQEIGTALRHMADEADPMVGSLARDGFGLDEIAAMPAAPPTGQADEELRDRIRRVLAEADGFSFEGLEPHDYQRHADAVLSALPTSAAVCICQHAEQQHFEDACLVCDCGDYLVPEAAREVIARWRQAATEVAEPHRLALSTALGLGTSAPWDAIRERAAELHQAQQPECALCGHRTCMLGKPCGVIATEHGDLPERCGCTGDGAQQAAPAVPQCDGCGHLVHRARKCPAVRYGERCECDEPLAVAEPDKETRPAIPCSWSATRYQHSPHDWNPQPGMDPVRCPGWSDGEPTP